jgi:hypothetical protein
MSPRIFAALFRGLSAGAVAEAHCGVCRRFIQPDNAACEKTSSATSTYAAGSALLSRSACFIPQQPAVYITLDRMLSRLGVLVLLATSATVAGCDAAGDLLGGCGNEVLRSAVSPSGAKSAIVFRRDCGATTGFTTQVSIVRGRETEVTGSGNTLIVEGRPDLEVRWLSDSELLVSRLGSGRIFEQQERVGGTTIKYAY